MPTITLPKNARPLLRAALILAVTLAGLSAVGRPASAATGSFTGVLTTSATTVAAGTPFTVTQTATNLTATQLYPITVGIRRLGFTVTGSVPPRTGLCRIAGSATCSFLVLAPSETQSYTLTLTANTPGTYQLQGWASSTSVPGGALTTITITVR
jgi:hypothetical protein